MKKKKQKSTPKKSFKIRAGDTVKVISGPHKSKVARVLEVIPEKERVRLEDVFTVKKHIAPQKSSKHPEGGIIEFPGTTHISNVMLFSKELDRAVRVGHIFDDSGKKKRVARGRNVKAVEV